MQERADSIGARFGIASQPGQGTSVEVTVPQSKPARAARVAL
jgi:signal transduction histidine kinase